MLKKYVCLLAVCTLSLGLFACAANDEVVTEPEVSEVAEESVSEEVSEEMSAEIVSEEVSEIEVYDDVQMVDFDDYEALLEYVDTLDETVLAVVNEEGKAALLHNGEHYKSKEGDMMSIESPKHIMSVTSEKESVRIMPGAVWSDKYDGNLAVWYVILDEEGTNIEVPLTITYVSVTGETTEEAFTVYITKE